MKLVWCFIFDNKKLYCAFYEIILLFVSQVLELETRMHEFVKEKEHMQLVHRMQEETAASALQEQLRSVQAQCQELLDKVSQIEKNVNVVELKIYLHYLSIYL